MFRPGFPCRQFSGNSLHQPLSRTGRQADQQPVIPHQNRRNDGRIGNDDGVPGATVFSAFANGYLIQIRHGLSNLRQHIQRSDQLLLVGHAGRDDGRESEWQHARFRVNTENIAQAGRQNVARFPKHQSKLFQSLIKLIGVARLHHLQPVAGCLQHGVYRARNIERGGQKPVGLWRQRRQFVKCHLALIHQGQQPGSGFRGNHFRPRPGGFSLVSGRHGDRLKIAHAQDIQNLLQVGRLAIRHRWQRQTLQARHQRLHVNPAQLVNCESVTGAQTAVEFMFCHIRDIAFNRGQHSVRCVHTNRQNQVVSFGPHSDFQSWKWRARRNRNRHLTSGFHARLHCLPNRSVDAE